MREGGSPGGTCGIAHSHKMFPFRLSFPEPHWVRQEGLEKLVSKLGKLHTSLTWGRGGCCGHLLRDRDSPCSMPGGNQGMGTLRGRMGTQLSLVLVQNSKPRNHVWE